LKITTKLTVNGGGVAYSGNLLVSTNVIALRSARLVLGWVTVCGRVNDLVM